MGTLTKKDLIYLHILHTVWTLADYYSKLFGIDACECPTDIPCGICKKNGKTVLRFSFQSLPSKRSAYSVSQMAEMMQEYLQFCLLPQQTELKPYYGGAGQYDVVESLYIDSIQHTSGGYQLNVVYVDNPIAYQYVKNKCGLSR